MPFTQQYTVRITQRCRAGFHETPGEALKEAIEFLGISDQNTIVEVFVTKSSGDYSERAQ